MAAEVRCPMCNKMNPADAEVCRFCKSKLKPGAARSSSAGGVSQSASRPVAGSPDWLSKIRDRARQEDSSSASLFGQEPEKSDASDWLSSLKADSEAPSQGSGAGEDWMSGLGGESKDAGPIPGSEAMDFPDWLGGAGPASSAPSTPASKSPPAKPLAAVPPAESSASNDWSSFLGGAFDQSASPASPAAEQPGEDDWMKSLSSWQTGPAPESPAPAASQAAPAEDTPFSFDQDQSSGWGQIFQEPATSASPGPAAPSADENLDWLRGFDASPTPSPAQPEQPAAQGDFGGSSFFDSQFSASSPPSETPASDFSGWGDFGQLGGAPAPAQSEAQAPSPEEQSTGVPDWLNALPSAPSGGQVFSSDSDQQPDWLNAAPESNAPASLGDEAGLPDWLTGGAIGQDSGPGFSLDAPTPSGPAAQKPGGIFAEEDGLPAWLRSDQDSPPASAAMPPQPPAAQTPTGGIFAPEEGGLPDWLHSDQDTAPDSAPKPAAQTPVFSFDEPTSGGVSDWLSSFGEVKSPANEPPQAAEADASTAQAGASDWLAGFGVAAVGAGSVFSESTPPPQQPPARPTTGGTGPLPFTEESLPDWLGDFKGQEPAQPAASDFSLASSSSPIVDNKPFDIELPAWLEEEGLSAQSAGGAGVLLPEDEGSGSEELAQADLPTWVQAMRPVETVMSDETEIAESDQRVEKAGPLAGIRGVLPVEESVLNYRKPPTYAVKLRVSEKQRSQVSLLDSLLAREMQTKSVAPASSRTPRIVQRVVVAVFLLIMLFSMVVLNIQIFPIPRLGPLAIENMYRQVDGLQAGDTVLLAVDYEPAFSGEMRFAAVQVIDHLMRKKARITIVSTIPAGPALADELLRVSGERNADYVLVDNVENLGYLPGGTISLLEFARNPRRAAPGHRNGAEAWASSPVLSGIADIKNFKQVIVLTDRAEIGRAWVEQVQPLLGKVPLLMVSSTQAGPLLEPYVSSKQIQGMVSGLMGGTLYGQWTGRNDPNIAPARYWGAYQAGLLVAFLLVLVGGVFSGVTAMKLPKPQGPAKAPAQKESRRPSSQPTEPSPPEAQPSEAQPQEARPAKPKQTQAAPTKPKKKGKA